MNQVVAIDGRRSPTQNAYNLHHNLPTNLIHVHNDFNQDLGIVDLFDDNDLN